MKVKVLFYVPHLNTIYAGRVIYRGYSDAFQDLGHEFRFLTASDDQEKVLAEFQPNMLFMSMGAYPLKFINLDLVQRYRKGGMKVFVNMPFWRSYSEKLHINEDPPVSQNPEYVRMIKSGELGDVFYNIADQDDLRMEGFEEETGYKHYSVPLATNKLLNFHKFSEKFKCEISYLGTNLPRKREFFEEYLFPLKKKYDLKVWGHDWTWQERMMGHFQRASMYFNIPILKDWKRPEPVSFEEGEPMIHSSSLINLNIHEDFQRKYGGDCNERTFKIPGNGGFEVVDNVACIRKYFVEDKEMVIAKDSKDWFEKIDYYIKNPEKRIPIIEAGQKRVFKDHTYHNRVNQLIGIYKSL